MLFRHDPVVSYSNFIPLENISWRPKPSKNAVIDFLWFF